MKASQRLEEVVRDALADILGVAAERVLVSVVLSRFAHAQRIDVLVDGESSPRAEQHAAHFLSVAVAAAEELAAAAFQSSGDELPAILQIIREVLERAQARALVDLEHVVRLGDRDAVCWLLTTRGRLLPLDVREQAEGWLCEDAGGPLPPDLVAMRAAALAIVAAWAKRRAAS